MLRRSDGDESRKDRQDGGLIGTLLSRQPDLTGSVCLCSHVYVACKCDKDLFLHKISKISQWTKSQKLDSETSLFLCINKTRRV